MKHSGVRFPITLFQRIQTLAKQASRSFKSQVLHMLQACLARKEKDH